MKKTNGFTLVEMLVVIAIIGLVALIGVPAFLNYLHAYKLRATSMQIVNDIRLTRQLAVTKNIPYKFTFEVPGTPFGSPSTYSLKVFNTGPGIHPSNAALKTAANWNDLNTKFTRELPNYISFIKSNADAKYCKDLDSDSSFDIIFKPDGTVFDDSGNVTFNEDKGTTTTAIENNSPHLILKTKHTGLPTNSYLLYVTYVGKISTRAYNK